ATLTVAANYIYYNRDQDQSVNTDYFLPNDEFLRNNSFLTNSTQKSNIFTGQGDISTSYWGGKLELGAKLSKIDTESKINFFD
ncbi:outer membrane beta-barrel protein, partial [Staphylococcus equorum]|uniref:outer membrane beta-barrel protein n=1 Tax=Staphylococcus equorum TaxID=246432 RepID=UPI0022AFA3B9